jgi:hypothetical protein
VRVALAFFVLLAAAAPAQGQTPLATCFWEGPISTEQPTTRGFDGRNFNFPEESATYWLARFSLPGGAALRLRGEYAHARYISLNAYSDGSPTDTLSDTAIGPDPGSVNPFVLGARRDRKERSWTVRVVNETPPADERAPNTLYAQPQPGQAIELAYRVYEPDYTYDLTGGTGLPAVELVRADGSVARDQEACDAINDADRSIPVQTVPAETWRAATSCRPQHPAFDPVRWERFFNLNYATLSVPADCTEAGFLARRQAPAQQQGGLYSNRDTSYVFTHLSRLYGELVVLTGKLPSFPATRDGQRFMADGQLRFWSLCSGESRVTVRTPDCLADRQLALGKDRTFTIVVSKAADKPANARPECGINWLDWGDAGDGAGNPDYGLLIMRNMLVSPDFKEAIQNVPRPGAEATTMGAYLPQTIYASRAQFESRGCPKADSAKRAESSRAPAAFLQGLPPSRGCRRINSVRFRLIGADGQSIRSARVVAAGRRWPGRRRGDRYVAVVRYRGRSVKVTISAVLGDGRSVRVVRRYRRCG